MRLKTTTNWTRIVDSFLLNNPQNLLFPNHSQHNFTSSCLLLLLLSAGRRGSVGFTSQSAADHWGPAAWLFLHLRSQHALRQFLSPAGPRRLPLEPGGRRGRVRLLWHLRPGWPAEELRCVWTITTLSSHNSLLKCESNPLLISKLYISM